MRTAPRHATGRPSARDPDGTSRPYQVAGFNFPINFLPAGPVPGLGDRRDLAPVPGSADTLRSVERAWRRPGPNAGHVLRFQFELTARPENVDDGFGFLIGDFPLATHARSRLLSAWLCLAGDAGRRTPLDVTASTRLLATAPVSVMFATPPGVTWSSLHPALGAGAVPRRLALDYFVELTRPVAFPGVAPDQPSRHAAPSHRRAPTVFTPASARAGD